MANPAVGLDTEGSMRIMQAGEDATPAEAPLDYLASGATPMQAQYCRDPHRRELCGASSYEELPHDTRQSARNDHACKPTAVRTTTG